MVTESGKLQERDGSLTEQTPGRAASVSSGEHRGAEHTQPRAGSRRTTGSGGCSTGGTAGHRHVGRHSGEGETGKTGRSHPTVSTLEKETGNG